MYPENKDKADFLNITKYHDAGFKGQGIKIAVYDTGFDASDYQEQFGYVKPLTNASSLNRWVERSDGKSDHGMIVLDVIRQIAPEAEVYFENFGGFSRFLHEVKERGDIDIVNISMSSRAPLAPLVDSMDDEVMFTSAGNNGIDSVVNAPGNHKNFITVGSSTRNDADIRRSNYSTVDDHVEVTSLNNWYVKGLRARRFRGTSCTSPAVAAMMALFMSANEKINREQARELIRNNVIDLYDEGRDAKTGYGLFILPDEIPYKKLETPKYKVKGSVIMPTFSDVNEDFWAYKSIERMAEAGYIRGYQDGTFKPNENLTRAQLAVILDRFIQDQK